MLPWAHRSQYSKRHLDWVSHFCTAHGRPLSLPNCPFAQGDLDPSNTWFLGPTRVHNSNDISIHSAVSAGLTIVTDRPTDRPCYRPTRSVTIGRIYVVLRCGPINDKASGWRARVLAFVTREVYMSKVKATVKVHTYCDLYTASLSVLRI